MSVLKISAVWMLLHLFSQVCYCHQSQVYPYVSFRGVNLANHSYVDLSLVNNTASGSVQCHTDLTTCCTSGQGVYKGDWYFPNGSQLQVRSGGGGGDMYHSRAAERVDLRRRNDVTASGIYQCSIPTVDVYDYDPSVRDYVYVGLYDSGGDISITTDTLDFVLAGINEANTPEFNLTCISTGGPATTVTWTRDSVTVKGTETVLDDPVTAQYTHTLTVTGRQAGLYTCTVANNKPTSDSSSLRVKVASVADNLSLKQDGETTIIISWTTPTPLGETTGYTVYYTSYSSSESSTVTDASTSISLTSLEPGQYYSISIVGLSEHLPSEPVTSSIFLHSLPRDVYVTVNTVTTTMISLSVTLSSYDSRTNYNISVAWSETLPNSCSGEAGDSHRERYTPNKEYSITNLNAGSDYDIVVAITNVAGSITSNGITVTTMTKVPSDTPVNIMTSNLTIETTSSITITWKPVPCIHRNGDISGYVVVYRERNGGPVSTERITGTTEVKITGLQLSTEYEIAIAAFNSVGTGPFTNGSFDTDATMLSSSERPQGCNAGTDYSAPFAALAVSFALNITLATVTVILIIRMRRSTKDVMKSSKAGTSVHLDVPVAPNEAYALHSYIRQTK